MHGCMLGAALEVGKPWALGALLLIAHPSDLRTIYLNLPKTPVCQRSLAVWKYSSLQLWAC